MKPTTTHTKPAAAAVLLAEVAGTGVSIRVEGDVLYVRGPRAQETLIRSLLARKGEVLAALAPEAGGAGRAGEAAAATTTSTSPAPPTEPLLAAMGTALSKRAKVGAPVVSHEPDPAAPSDPEADELLAEVLALLPRVNRHWRSYIRTRLEVDVGHADRLRRVRDWTCAHAELTPR